MVLQWFTPPPAPADAGAVPPGVAVETLAGPGHCPDGGAQTAAVPAPAGLAVDRAGRLFYDVDPPGAGLVVKVDEYGRPKLLPTGVPRQESLEAGDSPLPRSGAERLAPDGDGGVVLAAGRRLVQVAGDGALATIAGRADNERDVGPGTSSGDGGAAVSAAFTDARGVVADEMGNLYVADVVDHRRETVVVRFVNRGTSPVTFFAGSVHERSVAPGAIDTIAGVARGGRPGEGPARTARLHGGPPALAVAPGRLYLALAPRAPSAAMASSSVWLVNLSGQGIQAHGVAVGAARVARVAGRVGGEDAPAGAGTALAARLPPLPSIAADAAGNLYLADEAHHRVRRVDAAGRIETVAGSGGTGRRDGAFNGNDRPARRARLDGPVDVEVAPNGSLYVSDRGNRQVRVVDTAGVIRAAPGKGVGPAPACRPRAGSGRVALPEPAPAGAPTSVAAAPDGSVYFVAADLRQVKRLRPSGRVETVVGNARWAATCSWDTRCRGPRGDGGPAAVAVLQRPTALALDVNANLYVLDPGDGRVRFVNLGRRPVKAHGVAVAPGRIATVAGTGVIGVGGDGGPALRARFGGLALSDERVSLSAQLNLVPRLALGSLAADGKGNLFVADPANHRVRRIDADGILTTVLGDDAPRPSPCCRHPAALAVDAAGNLYVADHGLDDQAAPHPRIWVVNRTGGPIRALATEVPPEGTAVVAGNGAFGVRGDGGPAVAAELLAVSGISLDGGGALYLTEVGEDTIDAARQYVGAVGYVRRVEVTGTITTVAGDGVGGFNGDGMHPRLTSLNFPAGVAVDRCGDVLVADLGNDRVRRGALGGRCSRTEGGTGHFGDAAAGRSWWLRAVPVVAGAAALVAGLGIARSHRGRSRSP